MYKKIFYVVLLTVGLSGVAFADDFDDEYADDDNTGYFEKNAGIFFGGQIGTTNMHYSPSTGYLLPSDNTYDTSYKLAARGYLGYAFSQFISLELGYSYYGRPKFKHSGGNTQEITQQGMDLMVKANLPLDYGFGFYLKGGMAWVHRSALHSNAGTFASKVDNDKFPPIGALGINYWFAPNIALDLCWTKTMTVSDLPTIDLWTLGFIYKINI